MGRHPKIYSIRVEALINTASMNRGTRRTRGVERKGEKTWDPEIGKKNEKLSEMGGSSLDRKVKESADDTRTRFIFVLFRPLTPPMHYFQFCSNIWPFK